MRGFSGGQLYIGDEAARWASPRNGQIENMRIGVTSREKSMPASARSPAITVLFLSAVLLTSQVHGFTPSNKAELEAAVQGCGSTCSHNGVDVSEWDTGKVTSM